MSINNLYDAITGGKPTTRREFMKKAVALGLSATAAGVLLRSRPASAQPKKGGILRLGLATGAIQDSLSPDLLNSATAYIISWSARNSLCEINSSGELIPELAESWEVTPDVRTWTFKIKKGVEFHNGKTMDVDDVIHSLNLHRGEGSKSAAKVLLDPVEDIKADGKHTLVITLKKGNADFAYLMSDYRVCIVPSGLTSKDMAMSAMGTGAYILEDYEPGVRARSRRNPNYWKAGRGHFDGLEFLILPDVVARTNALRTGSIDYMNRCDLRTVDLLARVPNLKVMEVTGNQHYTLPMDCRIEPFNDNNVRLALKHAVNREELVGKILHGHGAPANDHPIGKGNRYFAKDLPQRTYDPDKARFYLKKAGRKSLSVEISLADAAYEGAVDTGVLYREQAAKAGIDITVKRVPNDGYWDKVWMHAPWCASYYGGRPTEDWMFSWIYSEGATWNEAHWKNDRFNTLLKAARIELDDAKRREMYGEMQQIVRDEGGSVIPMYANYVDAASSKLKYDSLAANYPTDGFRGPERWWFA